MEDGEKKLIELAEHIKKEYEDGKVEPMPEGSNTEGIIQILNGMISIIKKSEE